MSICSWVRLRFRGGRGGVARHGQYLGVVELVGHTPKMVQFENWNLIETCCRGYCLSQRVYAKIWLALLWAIHQHSRYVLQECLCLSENRKLWNWSKSKSWNCVSQVVMLLWFCQQAMERVKFIKCFVGKAFPLELECQCASDLPTQHQVNSIIKERCINMNWLSLAFLPSIWETESDIYLKLSTAIGKHVTAVQFLLCLNAKGEGHSKESIFCQG